MNTRRFVSLSSVLLAGWLSATFFYEMPSQRYPKLDKTPATAAIGNQEPDQARGEMAGAGLAVAPGTLAH